MQQTEIAVSELRNTAYGAVEVTPGLYAMKMLGGRYRVTDDPERFWRYVGPGNAGAGIGNDWAPLMPSWWTPGQLVAWKIMSARDEEPDPAARYDHEPTGLAWPMRAVRIAADLTTGEEVPA